ncbi:hypothetical protein KIPB_016545, partial [Kipferlia bialata]
TLGAQCVADAVAVSRYIVTVDVSDSFLSQDGCVALLTALSGPSSAVGELSLAGNNLGGMRQIGSDGLDVRNANARELPVPLFGPGMKPSKAPKRAKKDDGKEEPAP